MTETPYRKQEFIDHYKLSPEEFDELHKEGFILKTGRAGGTRYQFRKKCCGKKHSKRKSWWKFW